MPGKRVFVLALLVVAMSAVPALAAKEIPNVVAVVNGEKITKDMLTATLLDWNAPTILDEMIDQRIVAQEARKNGVVVTAEQINAEVEKLKGRASPGQSFEEMLRQWGMTPGHLVAKIKMRLQAEGVVRKSIKVAPEDLQDYRKASHILIRAGYSANADEKQKKEQEAKDKIDKIAQEIKEGLAFDEAAKKYSEDPGTKDKGGDLGWFTKNYMAPEFEKAAFELQPGQVSEPVKTSFGYHLIKLMNVGAEAKDQDKADLEEKIVQSRLMERLNEWFLSLKNKAKVDNKLAPPKPKEKPSQAPPAPPAGPNK